MENLENKQEILNVHRELREKEGNYRLPPEAIRYFAEESKWFEEGRERGERPRAEYDMAEKLCRIIVEPKDLKNKDLSKYNFGIKRVLYRELFLRSQLRYEDEDESHKFKMAFNSFFRPLLYYEDEGKKSKELSREREKLVAEQNKLTESKFIPKSERTKRLYQIAERIREIKNNPHYSLEFLKHIDNLPHFIPNYQKEFEGFKKSHPEKWESDLKEKFIVEKVPDILEKLYQSLYQMYKKRYLDKLG